MTSTKAAHRCRVCSHSGASPLTASGLHYSRCRKCGVLQQELTEDEYLAMNPGYDPGIFLEDQSEAQIRAFLKVPQLTARIRSICETHGRDPKGMDYLDVGCGMGGYMLAASDLGMSALGFEPSANHGKVAQATLSLPVVADYFSPDKVGDRKFDFILLSHVIEHIYWPGKFIEELVSVLKPGGILVMITPNANSPTARLTGKHWPMLVPIDHVTMMTANGFGHVAPANCKLSIETSEFPSEFAATLASIVKRQFKGRAVNHADMPVASRPKLMREVSWRSKALRGALAVVSAPAYLLSRATGNAAALIATMVKNG